MFREILRLVLIVMCSLVLMAGCASRVNKLTTEERSSLRKLIFIPEITKVIVPKKSYLQVEKNYMGTTVRLLGASRHEKMSVSTYESLTAEAIEAAQNCISTSYGNKTYVSDKIKSLMSELITQNNPFNITFVSEAEQKQFFDLSKEGKAAFIKSHNADAALIICAYPVAGLSTKPLFSAFSAKYRGLRTDTVGVAYLGLYAKIDDYQSDGEIYFSGHIFTEHIPVAYKDFCKEFIGGLENAVDEQTPRWYNEIIGVK